MVCDKNLRKKNIELSENALRNSVTPDILMIQAVSMFETLDSVQEVIFSKFKEWYGYYYPELERKPGNFIEDVIKDKRPIESLGGVIKGEHKQILLKNARFLKEFSEAKKQIDGYIQESMKKICPNITALAGYVLGLKIIKQAGSLKHLAELPASTIQLLGAEKALFRHLAKKAKSPKYGLLFNHPLVQKAKNKGKAAKLVADKLAICARLDYFKGEFRGEDLRKKIEQKIK
ncbi:hypothetical protein HYV79_05105 [Candidatus Woesearchaeota archaeon]|nr:hypothetical protein [Candidatus Woesearchaeota archaeon]